ncbi:MAG: GNAT family N-acetyltransferase [Christensenellales bacterium]
MKTRLAVAKDLPELKMMFDKIVKVMESNNVFIWNEYYPYEEFENDIQNKNLYVAVDDSKIISAFGLFDNVSGSNCFEWSDKNVKALYLGRFGVNPDYQNCGYGAKTINEAIKITKSFGAKYLRLQVVDTNIPAINFYKKIGFDSVNGKFEESIEETDTTLIEYGFEIKL